jgi:hypothetical protein
MTTVAIHQPNYLPWLGYFHKIYASDIFVFLDDVEFTKSYIHRTKVRKKLYSTDTKWLIVPIKDQSSNDLIKDVQVATDINWKQDHLNTIKYLYAKAPFFHDYYHGFSTILLQTRPEDFKSGLVHVNTVLTGYLMKVLGIKTNEVFSSELGIKGKKSEYVANLSEHFKADIYLSGSGAKNYNVPEHFESRGIKVAYSEFFQFLKKNPYPQRQGDYIPGLSIIDAMFNIGVEGILEIFERCEA